MHERHDRRLRAPDLGPVPGGGADIRLPPDALAILPVPAASDLHRTGTIANILRMVTTPDGTHQLVCQGVQRFRVLDWVRERPFIAAGVYRIEEPDTRTAEVEARFLNLKRQAAE